MLNAIKKEIAYRQMKKNLKNKNLELDFSTVVDEIFIPITK